MGTVTAGVKIPGRVCRTLDRGDFSLLHQLTWFNMAVHSNAEYAKGTWFQERSLAGPVIFAVADGLSTTRIPSPNCWPRTAMKSMRISAWTG